jgi:hypothetical protein
MKLQLDPEGGCPGHRRVGRVCALCLTCARLPVGSQQVQGCVKRGPDGEDSCDLWIAHGAQTVRPIPVERHPADLGGLAVTVCERSAS